MITQKSSSTASNVPFQLQVTLEGCFVFALSVATDGDTINGINVYAPDCGHIYSGGIPGQWNNPYAPASLPLTDPLLFMLQPRQYCLEVNAPAGGGLSLSALKQNIGAQNIWVDGSRPIGQGPGWDLVVTLPVPDGVTSWSTMSISVGDCFQGSASETFTQIGMSQTLTYQNVTDFSLRGSPLPLAGYTVVDGVVPFTISTEPPCVPSIEHQRMAVQGMAQMVGLDLSLQNPLSGTMQSSGELLIPMNTKNGSCMGGIVGLGG